jgi:hypothetical protein
MTHITTGCPRCGRVELEVDDVTLVVSPCEDAAWYLFDCTGCVRRVVKPAPSTVVLALSAVRTAVWTVPAEVLERAPDPQQVQPITVDDVLDARLLLGALSDGDLLSLAAGTAPGQAPSGGAGGVTNPSPDAKGSRPARPNAA